MEKERDEGKREYEKEEKKKKERSIQKGEGGK